MVVWLERKYLRNWSGLKKDESTQTDSRELITGYMRVDSFSLASFIERNLINRNINRLQQGLHYQKGRNRKITLTKTEK